MTGPTACARATLQRVLHAQTMASFATFSAISTSLAIHFPKYHAIWRRKSRSKRVISPRKNVTLQILYDVASSVNTTQDIQDLLGRSLNAVKGIFDARAANIRLLDSENNFRLLTTSGFRDQDSDYELLENSGTGIMRVGIRITKYPGPR